MSVDFFADSLQVGKCERGAIVTRCNCRTSFFAAEASPRTPVVTATASDDVTEGRTIGHEVTPRSVAVYFECAIVFIGTIGTAANAIILYAMVASNQHRKQVLIFNQNAQDLFSSVFLVITYGAKLGNVPLVGWFGYWWCKWLVSENILWCGILASKVNLILVTIERYLKVTSPGFSKRMLRSWRIYIAAAFSWIFGFALSIGITLTTTDVLDGICYAYVLWNSRASQLAYGIFYFLFFFLIMIAIFIFCYVRILILIRKQAQVMATHTAAGSSVRTNQVQSNIIKTMIIVSAFYAISEMPMEVYYLILNIDNTITLLESGYYTSLFISFLYICTNPFVYAAKFDPVKRILVSWIPCKKTPEQPTESFNTRPVSTARAQQERY